MFVLPKTPAELAALQRVRRREAFEKARRSRLLGPRLAGIRAQHLDDDDEWRRIPLLTKEDLRALPAADFHDAFCISPRSAISEYWRSGGVTGKPTFYGRSATDMVHAIESFRRVWYAIGAVPGDGVHVSFPLGIHPIGSIIARSAQIHGMSTVWAGAGNTTPSELQLELLQTLRPTIWAGMSSYCLHLANVAEAKGIDLTRLTVRKILVSAEQLTDAKRAKIARTWGADVYDCLGMTEGGMMLAETATSRPAMAAWADLFYFEVVNEETGLPVPEGEPGSLVVTPLMTNNVTPFLRWKSGDQVTLTRPPFDPDDPLSVLPRIQHAHRTSGFFKLRGVNINHTEFEDFVFAFAEIADFKAEMITVEDLEVLRVTVEIRRGADAAGLLQRLRTDIRKRFEVTPEVVSQEMGTLAREFEQSVKAPRFVDKRT